MKREIKFRAWGKFSKKMFFWGHEDWGIIMHNNGLRAYEKPPIGCEADELIPMQYTGLYDKNGKEIYERDVVKIDWHYDDDIEIKEMFAEVIFTCGSFMAVNKDKNYWIDLDNNLITVIGNVFENPELLK